MLKKLLFALFLTTTFVQSQNSIGGTMSPVKDYNWIVLYQLKGANQLFIKNSTIKDGKFSIDFPKNAEKGMYRLFFDVKNLGFVDFMYNDESVEVQFDPKSPSKTLTFISSEENILYNKYLKESVALVQGLESLQISNFKLLTDADKNINKNLYKQALEQYLKTQSQFESDSKGMLVHHFIKANRSSFSPAIFESAQEYMNHVKNHYFDAINFKIPELLNSTFLSGKVVDYVFYLNKSENADYQTFLYKSSVKEIVGRIGDNPYVKSELLTVLLYTFAQIEDRVLVDYLISDFYVKLPAEYQNKAVIKEVQSKVKFAVGKTVPDFDWKENGTAQNLLALDKAATYILVFWSTDCSHCLTEIPELYEFTKDNENIHVVAFALEQDELGFEHYAPKYKKWTHVLGLNKWQNPIVRLYKIRATPTYFILDKEKKIIAKPESIKDVISFFENQK